MLALFVQYGMSSRGFRKARLYLVKKMFELKKHRRPSCKLFSKVCTFYGLSSTIWVSHKSSQKISHSLRHLNSFFKCTVRRDLRVTENRLKRPVLIDITALLYFLIVKGHHHERSNKQFQRLEANGTVSLHSANDVTVTSIFKSRLRQLMMVQNETWIHRRALPLVPLLRLRTDYFRFFFMYTIGQSFAGRRMDNGTKLYNILSIPNFN